MTCAVTSHVVMKMLLLYSVVHTMWAGEPLEPHGAPNNRATTIQQIVVLTWPSCAFRLAQHGLFVRHMSRLLLDDMLAHLRASSAPQADWQLCLPGAVQWEATGFVMITRVYDHPQLQARAPGTQPVRTCLRRAPAKECASVCLHCLTF